MTGDGWQTPHEYAADLRMTAVATWQQDPAPDVTELGVDWAALAPVAWAPIEAPTTTKDGS